MTDKPILFNTDNVKAILADRKTQTRRVMKPQPELYPPGWLYGGEYYMDDAAMQSYLFHDVYGNSGSPYGSAYADGTSDALWVRETCKLFSLSGAGTEASPCELTVKYKAGNGIKTVPLPQSHGLSFEKWRPSIFMPRWASRITLRVTAVRVERVQDISRPDVHAEGVLCQYCKMQQGDICNCTDAFSHLWDSINAKRGHPWQSNPWVWVVEFERAMGAS
jgi:hypothetical protein